MMWIGSVQEPTVRGDCLLKSLRMMFFVPPPEVSGKDIYDILRDNGDILKDNSEL